MKILVSGLGFSRGSLYSAIGCIKPDKVYLITSNAASAALPEILDRCEKDFGRKPMVESYSMADPFIGFAEGRRYGDHIARCICEGDLEYRVPDGVEVFVNLVGGTTAIQDAVVSVARLLESASEVAVIDRRPAELQKSDPYVLGEYVRIKC